MRTPPAELAAAARPPSHRSVLLKLLAVIAAAFAFGFALVPLYDVFCQATGLNGKTAGKPTPIGTNGLPASAASGRIDTGRTLTIEFTGTVMPGLPWEMTPLTARLDVHPGEMHQASFRVRNLSDKAIVGQAIPSVTPGLAARHFEKLDCFCFAQQTLAAGETKEMPLTFIVNPQVDAEIHTITLAYAFFVVDSAKAAPTAVARR